MAQERPRNYFVGVFEKSETFFWEICARSERYINILAGIFEIPPFLWKHRVSIVTGLSTAKQNPTLFQSIVSRKMVCRALIIGVGLIANYSVSRVPYDAENVCTSDFFPNYEGMGPAAEVDVKT